MNAGRRVSLSSSFVCSNSRCKVDKYNRYQTPSYRDTFDDVCVSLLHYPSTLSIHLSFLTISNFKDEKQLEMSMLSRKLNQIQMEY